MNPRELQEKISDRYKLLSALGRGGMGAVYRAFDKSLDREVALKVILSSSLGDRNIRERFRREILSMSKVTHPNVVRFIDYVDNTEVTYFTMELIDGESLHSLFYHNPCEVNSLVRMVAELAEGLAAIHKEGIIHRDIKPANIVVSQEGTAKLMDFGLVKLLDAGSLTELTKTGHFVGTISYLPPEVLLGQKCGPKSDVYQLALVLYKGMTSRLPFEVNGLVEMVRDVKEREIPVLDHPAVDNELQKIVITALSKDPEERPTAREFAEGLHSWLDKGKLAVSVATPINKAGKSRKIVAFGSLTAVLLFFGFLAYFLFQPNAPETKLKFHRVVETRDENVTTSLHIAAAKGKIDQLKAVVSTGVNINVQDHVSCTPLAWAAINGHTACCEYLVKNGADLDIADFRGRTPLHKASYYGRLEVVKLLLKASAKVDRQDKGGQTSLHLAAYKGYHQVVQELIDAEANVQLLDDRGRTALMMALEDRHPATANFLIAAGVDTRVRDDLGATALHLAAGKGLPACIPPLVNAGAQLDVEDFWGYSPYEIALLHQQTQSQKILAKLMKR